MDVILQLFRVDMAIQLLGFLVLTVLGLVVPIIAILLSIFRDGMLKLAAKYDSEKSQSENNLKEQLRKLTEAEETDTSAIKVSVKELEKIKKGAQSKLSYLNPKTQILKLFVPLLIAFLTVLITLWVEAKIYDLLLLLSLAAFTYAVIVLWRLIGIIVEVKAIIDADRQSVVESITDLLSKILAKTGTTTLEYFLKKVCASINGTNIQNNSHIFTIGANKKVQYEVGFRNSENRMAKKVEVGLVFPSTFLIERVDGYTIYSTGNEQIVRFYGEEVQANTHHLFGTDLIITPLNKGSWIVKTFIKAENIEPVYRKFTFRVV